LIHLTRLVDGKPVSEGPLKLELHPATGQPLVFTVAAPLRPGIFETELSVPSAGAYTLHVVAEGKGFSDRITVPGIQAGQPAQAQTAAKEEHKEPARPENTMIMTMTMLSSKSVSGKRKTMGMTIMGTTTSTGIATLRW